ncbi:MAG: hypothetical protein ACRD0A_20470 [Acidimicrobiales bacterium]
MSGEVEAAPDGPVAVPVDPYDCADCLAARDVCRFHAGFAEGWDACAELVARMVVGDG